MLGVEIWLWLLTPPRCLFWDYLPILVVLKGFWGVYRAFDPQPHRPLELFPKLVCIMTQQFGCLLVVLMYLSSPPEKHQNCLGLHIFGLDIVFVEKKRSEIGNFHRQPRLFNSPSRAAEISHKFAACRHAPLRGFKGGVLLGSTGEVLNNCQKASL